MMVRVLEQKKGGIVNTKITELKQCANPMLESLLLDFNKISENGRNIYE